MSRRPGERNWDEAASPFRLTIDEPILPRATTLARLDVEILTNEPPSYLVTHEDGTAWLVVTAADATLEFIDADETLLPDMRARIKNAIKRHERKKRGA
jgi:hypothetical protein